MNELPPGWATADLETVAELGSGGTPKAGVAAYYGGPIPWAIIGDLTDGPVSATQSTITELALSQSSAKIVSPDCVLIAMYGSIGRLGLPTIPMATNQAIAYVRPRTAVLTRKYLFFYLLSQRNRLSRAGKGATQQNISQTILRSWPIPLPPIGEQERIVAAIEEQFSRLDVGSLALGRLHKNLKRMRDAVYQSAISGRLHDPEPSSWRTVTVGDVAEVSGGITKNPRRAPHANPVPFLRVANVPRDRLDLGDIHLVEVFDGELERYRLRAGDLLVVEGNGSPDQIGRSALWKGEIDPCVHQNHLIRVRPSAEVIPEYLNLYWNAPSTMATVQAKASSTSGLHTLSTGKIRGIPVTLPSVEAQRVILEEVAVQLSRTSTLEATLTDAITRAANLRSAILIAAFSGKLMQQDPSDEPASLPLKRIASENESHIGHRPASVDKPRTTRSNVPA